MTTALPPTSPGEVLSEEFLVPLGSAKRTWLALRCRRARSTRSCTVPCRHTLAPRCYCHATSALHRVLINLQSHYDLVRARENLARPTHHPARGRRKLDVPRQQQNATPATEMDPRQDAQPVTDPRCTQCRAVFNSAAGISELSVSWGLGSSPLGDTRRAARSCCRIVSGSSSLSTSTAVAASASNCPMHLISIGENIVEQHAMPVADSFRWQQAVIDQTHNRRRLTPRRSGSFGGQLRRLRNSDPDFSYCLFIEFEWDSTRIGELSSGTPERSNCLWILGITRIHPCY